jgi:hypothetical protein
VYALRAALAGELTSFTRRADSNRPPPCGAEGCNNWSCTPWAETLELTEPAALDVDFGVSPNPEAPWVDDFGASFLSGFKPGVESQQVDSVTCTMDGTVVYDNPGNSSTSPPVHELPQVRCNPQPPDGEQKVTGKVKFGSGFTIGVDCTETHSGVPTSVVESSTRFEQTHLTAHFTPCPHHGRLVHGC